MKKFGVRDLARLANVSVGTVDRALNDRPEISDETKNRILSIARKNGYAPNLTARALSFSKSTLRIGICFPREIRYFYDSLYQGVVDEARAYQHVGLEVIFRRVPQLSSPMTRSVNTLLEEDIQALILTPGSASEVAPLIAKAELERNVRVVCVASDDSPSCRSTAILVDPDVNGGLAAELMANLVPSHSEVAVVTGMMITEEHRRKVEAFQKAFPMECNGGKSVRVIEGHEHEAEVYQKTLSLLRKYANLRGIYVSTVNCIPVCKAIEEQHRSGEVRIIATDLFAKQRVHFNRRTISAAIYQNPYQQGQLAVRLIMDHFINGREFPRIHYINPVVAFRRNLELFREMQAVPSDQRSHNMARSSRITTS